jgi:FkbM family methyltransferase
MLSSSYGTQLLAKKFAIKILSLVRLALAPRKLLWFIRVRSFAPFLPIDVLPSYEHKFLANLISDPSLVVDVGFNKGQFSSLILLLFPSTKVIAFDPSPQSLSKYVSPLYDAFPSRFKFSNVAVGDQDSCVALMEAISFDNNSLLRPTEANVTRFPRVALVSNTLTVPCVRLQSFFEGEMPSDDIFLKIDVQGYELQVLQGVGASLFEKIRWIYVELTELSLYEGQASAREIKFFLYSIGYILVGDYNLHLEAGSGQVEYCDSLFIRP